MGTKLAGFTVIETVLFIAISGLMMIMMITGTAVTLNNQRYNDSVRSFQSLVQEQYAKLISTENDRLVDRPCGLDGAALPQEDTSSTQQRGQSRCEIFGRYMAIEGSDITIFPVLVYRVESQKPASGSDVDLMRDVAYMQIGVDTGLAETASLEWGAEIAWPSSGSGARSPTTPRSVALLFVRSPDSGQVYTFASDTVVSNPANMNSEVIRSMIVAGDLAPGQAAQALCVNSGGMTFANMSSVYVNAFSSGPSSIETRTNDYFQLIGSDIRC